MKSIIIRSTLLSLLLIVCFSCQPRVELDLTRYGDTAFLLDARLFYLEETDRQVFEETGTVIGARRVFFSKGAAAIDDNNFTATITVDSTDASLLSQAGIVFTHRAESIEPLNGSPVAGIPANFTETPFTYKVYSADGTTHDWMIDVAIARQRIWKIEAKIKNLATNVTNYTNVAVPKLRFVTTIRGHSYYSWLIFFMAYSAIINLVRKLQMEICWPTI